MTVLMGSIFNLPSFLTHTHNGTQLSIIITPYPRPLNPILPIPNLPIAEVLPPTPGNYDFINSSIQVT